MGTSCSVLFTLFIICFQAPLLISQNITCNSDDLTALRGLQKGFTSENPSFWTTSNCCTWDGVFCQSLTVGSVSSKRVVTLNLGNRKLRGILSDSIFGLEQLKSFNISQNSLNGFLPSKLFQLQNLKVLDLSGNSFSGVFPDKINLPSIQIFNISKNDLIDTSFCSNSTNIKVVDLSKNKFSGSNLPGFANCTSLEDLFLNSNELSGSLPEDLFFLQNLRRLHLEDNSFSGVLSFVAATLSELVELDISRNRLSGFLPDFTSFEKLESFTAESNEFDGVLPSSLSAIRFLNLRNNSFYGRIAINCTQMANLTSLSLARNRFRGSIPSDLSLCQNLQSLKLDGNYLGGEIPTTFKNLKSLSVLTLTDTHLENISVALEILQYCRNLRILVLASNFRTEKLTVNSNLTFKNLQALVIPDCDLIGKLPHVGMDLVRIRPVDVCERLKIRNIALKLWRRR